MEDDRLLKQLNQLFDNKLKPVRDELIGQLAELSKRVQDGLIEVTAQLDTVAGHLAEVSDDLDDVKQTQQDHSEQLSRIERALVKHDDRLGVLEAKTAHLPTPPRG